MKKTFVTPMGKNAPGPARLDATATEAGGRDPRITLSRDESSFRILAAPDLPYPLKILSVLIFAGAGGVI